MGYCPWGCKQSYTHYPLKSCSSRLLVRAHTCAASVENSIEVPQKARAAFVIQQSHFWTYISGQNYHLERHTNPYVHSRSIHNSQDMEQPVLVSDILRFLHWWRETWGEVASCPVSGFLEWCPKWLWGYLTLLPLWDCCPFRLVKMPCLRLYSTKCSQCPAGGRGPWRGGKNLEWEAPSGNREKRAEFSSPEPTRVMQTPTLLCHLLIKRLREICNK